MAYVYYQAYPRRAKLAESDDKYVKVWEPKYNPKEDNIRFDLGLEHWMYNSAWEGLSKNEKVFGDWFWIFFVFSRYKY